MENSIWKKELQDYWEQIAKAFRGKYYEVSGHCPNCAAQYHSTSQYCHNCGEQKSNPKRDNSLYSLIMDLLAEIIQFNRKLLLTAIALITRPGTLTRAYYLGIRNKYYRPLTILSTLVLIFYTIVPRVTLFYEGANELNQGFEQRSINTSNIFHFNFYKVVGEKSQKLFKTDSQIVKEAEFNSSQMFRSIFWLIWPFWGLSTLLFLRKQPVSPIYHLVSSAHLFGAYLLLWIFVCLAQSLFNEWVMTPLVTMGVNVVFIFYIIIHLITAYNLRWPKGVLIGVCLGICFSLTVILFRQFVLIYSLESIK